MRRQTLTSKLIISTSIMILATIIACSYLTITIFKKTLLAEAVSDADKLTETIIRTTHYQMLENDLKRVYEMFQEVGTQQGIERVRLINKNGLIIFSTDSMEIGTLLDKQGAACNMCHAGADPILHASSMNRSRFFTDNKGNRVLGMAKAIYNEPVCSAAECHFHPEDARIVGVLDVIVSLEALYGEISSYRNMMILIAIILMALISLSLVFFIRSFVQTPVKQLLEHTRRVAAGDLDGGVGFSSGDELGELAQSFDIMTDNLRKARKELQEWGKKLEKKVEERTSEVKRMQAQLIRSEKLASLGELVAGISHEINNPLTGILLFSSLIADDKRLDAELRQDLETVVRESKRCAEIVKGLLDFSRESVPQKEPVSLNQILDLALALLENQSIFHNIQITKEYASTIPLVLADPNQMEQVFVNILVNASQAMGGSGAMIIRTGLNGDGGVFATISDTGCGIAEENLEKIFDPFFTTKSNKGTGLGLSVSYGIVENHGGVIGVESTVGIGTTFSISLPISPGGSGISPTPGNPPAPAQH